MCELTCVSFKPFEKGALRGFVSLEIPSLGLRLLECSLFIKDGRRWVAWPAKSVNSGGVNKWVPLVETTSRAKNDVLQKAALVAVDAYLDAQAEVAHG